MIWTIEPRSCRQLESARVSRTFYVYILANSSKQLYVGVTGNVHRRLWEHRTGAIPGYTSRLGIDQLVYWEQTSNVRAAIEREKEIKNLKRRRKLALIENMNPDWKDL